MEYALAAQPKQSQQAKLEHEEGMRKLVRCLDRWPGCRLKQLSKIVHDECL